MAYFPDLSHYVFGRTLPEQHILNVGWLSKEHQYERGIAPEWLTNRLRGRVATPINLYRGYHACELCSAPAVKTLPNGIQMPDHPVHTLGNGEIRVRAVDGKIYVAPVLIYHYVTCHQYLPPEPFISALEADLPQPVLRDGIRR